MSPRPIVFTIKSKECTIFLGKYSTFSEFFPKNSIEHTIETGFNILFKVYQNGVE